MSWPSPWAHVRTRPKVYWDGRPVARQWAAEALGALGPAAKDALPALTEAQNDADSRVRGAASAAIRKIQPPPAETEKAP